VLELNFYVLLNSSCSFSSHLRQDVQVKPCFFNALVNFLVSENIQSKISVCFIALYLFEFVDFKGLYFFNYNQKNKKRAKIHSVKTKMKQEF